MTMCAINASGCNHADDIPSVSAVEFQKELKKDETVLVYCRSGRRSMNAAEILTELGYKVINLEGGIIDWEGNGLPTVE